MKKLRTNEAAWVEKSARWRISVQKDGERKQFYSSKPGKKGKLEAERKADEWLSGDEVKDMRFGVAYDMFIADKRRECGTGWVTKLESTGKNWLRPALEHKYLSKITQQDWKNAILNAYEDGKSKKTLEGIRGAITNFMQWADDNNLDVAPLKPLKIPADAPTGERNIVQPDGIKTLMQESTIEHYGKSVECWYIHAWRLMVILGLRRGELCGLQRDDIKDGRLTIRRSVNTHGEVTQGKTRAAQRTMVIPAHAQKILDEQAAMLRAAGIVSRWMFPDELGDMSDPNSVYKRWTVYARQHGIKSSLHELRHTHISLMQNTVPENMLKRMVGHTKNMDTFGVYGHEVDGEAQKAAALVDGVFNTLVD